MKVCDGQKAVPSVGDRSVTISSLALLHLPDLEKPPFRFLGWDSSLCMATLHLNSQPPTLAGGLEQVTFKGPFKPEPFCDSVTRYPLVGTSPLVGQVLLYCNRCKRSLDQALGMEKCHQDR